MESFVRGNMVTRRTFMAIEAGFSGFESYAWCGAPAPKGTPEEPKGRMRDAMVATLKEPAKYTRLTENMHVTTTFGGSAELATWVSKQIKSWGDGPRENNIKAGQ